MSRDPRRENPTTGMYSLTGDGVLVIPLPRDFEALDVDVQDTPGLAPSNGQDNSVVQVSITRGCRRLMRKESPWEAVVTWDVSVPKVLVFEIT